MSVPEILKTMAYGPAPESAEAANQWLDEHGRKFGLFINNTWNDPSTGEYYDNFNPATGERLAQTAQAGPRIEDDDGFFFCISFVASCHGAIV